MKKIIALLLSVLLVLPLFNSCMGEGEDISVFYYTYSDTYISSVRDAMDKAISNMGMNHHNYDANGNQSTQTEQIDTAISKGTRMLVVNIVDTGSDDAAKAIIEKAKSASIPVIFFNRSVDEAVVKSYDKCLFVGTDYEMAGHMQGQMIGNYIAENFEKTDINGDGKITYVLLKGQQGNKEAEARTKYSVVDANKILLEKGLSELSFYDKSNSDGYLVDQDGTWSNAAANNYMKTILSAYSEKSGNMVELVIANNDEMALGAIAALNEAGYNKAGGKTIPVFGVDATASAISKIESGAMAGTVKQDGVGMANAIAKVIGNMLLEREVFDGIDKENIIGDFRINIPYSQYTKTEED